MNSAGKIVRILLILAAGAGLAACSGPSGLTNQEARRLLEAGRPDQVVAGLSGLPGRDKEAYQLLAQAFGQLPGREEEAAEALAPAAGSGDLELVLLASRAAIAADRLTQAEEWLKGLVSAQPGAVEAAIEYAKLLATEGRFDEAVALLRRHESDDPRILNLIGYGELLAGRREAGRAALQRAVEIAGRAGRPYAPPHYHLGLDHASRGEWNEALAEFRTAAAANPNHLEAHYGWLAAAERLRLDAEIAPARQGFARLYESQLQRAGALDRAPERPFADPVERTAEVESRPRAGGTRFRRSFPAGTQIEIACLAPRGGRARFLARPASGGQALLDVIHEGTKTQDVWIPHRLIIPGTGEAPVALEFEIRPSSLWTRWSGGAAPERAAFSEPAVLPDKARRSLDPRPNILLISLDTLRADSLGVQGSGRPTTPFIDGLAARGVRFARCEAASNWTLPSHYSIFSGFTPGAHGVNPDLGQVRGFLFPDRRLAVRGSGKEVMLAEALAEAGYRTAGVTENGWVSARFGFDQGFRLYRSDLRGSLPATRAAALAELETCGEGGPWFLFVHTYAPHQPYHAPFSWRTKFADPGHIGFAWPAAKVPIKDYNRFHGDLFAATPGDVLAFRALFAGQAAWSDTLVRDLVNWLESRGLLERTVVVVTSDHGEEIFERGQFDHGDTLHEEVTHVPLVLTAPGRLPEGKVVAATVSQIDLAATLLDLAGLPGRLGEGTTLRPFWEGTGQARPAIAEARGKKGEELSAVWDGSLKYLRRQTPLATVEQVFDLAGDPGELHDLAGRFPAELERLRRLFALHRARAAEIRRSLGASDQTVDRETIESLKSLGYAH